MLIFHLSVVNNSSAQVTNHHFKQSMPSAIIKLSHQYSKYLHILGTV